jgi:hypothetical protein
VLHDAVTPERCHLRRSRALSSGARRALSGGTCSN